MLTCNDFKGDSPLPGSVITTSAVFRLPVVYAGRNVSSPSLVATSRPRSVGELTGKTSSTAAPNSRLLREREVGKIVHISKAIAVVAVARGFVIIFIHAVASSFGGVLAFTHGPRTPVATCTFGSTAPLLLLL